MNVASINYMDTNVLISLLNNREFNHEKALKALENFADMITSPLAILELKSPHFRSTNLCPDEIVAFAEYLSKINIKIPEADRDKVASYASELAIKISMRH